MLPVKLFARDGGFVASGRIPPFLAGQEPAVLLWGNRVFRHDGSGAGAVRYVEVFAMVFVDVDPIDGPEPPRRRGSLVTN